MALSFEISKSCNAVDIDNYIPTKRFVIVSVDNRFSCKR